MEIIHIPGPVKDHVQRCSRCNVKMADDDHKWSEGEPLLHKKGWGWIVAAWASKHRVESARECKPRPQKGLHA